MTHSHRRESVNNMWNSQNGNSIPPIPFGLTLEEFAAKFSGCNLQPLIEVRTAQYRKLVQQKGSAQANQPDQPNHEANTANTK